MHDDSSVDVTECPRANGMPMLGLGTWKNDDPDECATAVRTALEAGYRHVDTAQIYGNEAAVGEGIRAAAVDREDVFLASKVWLDNLAYEDAIETTRESLDRLGVDAVDLMYVHWPAGAYEPAETFRAFNELYDEGLIDRVGISNFEPDYVDTAVEYADVPIFANQVECHPLLQQDAVREACANHDIEVVAYSPLARGTVFDVPQLTEIAQKHGVSEAQVSLAWLRENGVTAIPKATGEDHILDNWASLGLDLDEEDLAKIDAIDREDRRVDPDFGPWNR
ncbi:MAG: aldo/keto reductase [Halobacteriota archaeon]